MLTMHSFQGLYTMAISLLCRAQDMVCSAYRSWTVVQESDHTTLPCRILLLQDHSTSRIIGFPLKLSTHMYCDCMRASPRSRKHSCLCVIYFPPEATLRTCTPLICGLVLATCSGARCRVCNFTSSSTSTNSILR